MIVEIALSINFKFEGFNQHFLLLQYLLDSRPLRISSVSFSLNVHRLVSHTDGLNASFMELLFWAAFLRLLEFVRLIGFEFLHDF
jgi:hypothetical protein